MEGRANKIVIANIPVAATTETPWALPKGCQWFQMQCRTAVAVQIAVIAHEVTNRYFTMQASTVLKERNLDVKERIPVYFYAASAVVIEAIMGIYEEEIGGE